MTEYEGEVSSGYVVKASRGQSVKMVVVKLQKKKDFIKHL